MRLIEHISEIRFGIQTARLEPQRYPHNAPTAIEAALETLDAAANRRELRAALFRIAAHIPGSEKRSYQNVIRGLDQVSDSSVMRLLVSARQRVATLPPPTQAFQAAVVMREMRANASRTIEFDASVWEKDRHGTRVDPLGLDTDNFRLNPLFMWQHSWSGGIFGGTPDIDNVLGRVVSWNATPRAFTIKAEFATHPKAELALSLVRQKMLSAVSIAFVPKKVERSIEDGVEVPIIRKADLLEVSLVFVPSSPSSGATGRK